MESSKQNADGPPTVSLKEAINQAQLVYKEKFQKSPESSARPAPENGGAIVNQLIKNQSQAPQAQIPMRAPAQAPLSAIEALKKFPEKQAEFKAKYGYLPE
jgi:hypothetical protein